MVLLLQGGTRHSRERTVRPSHGPSGLAGSCGDRLGLRRKRRIPGTAFRRLQGATKPGLRLLGGFLPALGRRVSAADFPSGAPEREGPIRPRPTLPLSTIDWIRRDQPRHKRQTLRDALRGHCRTLAHVSESPPSEGSSRSEGPPDRAVGTETPSPVMAGFVVRGSLVYRPPFDYLLHASRSTRPASRAVDSSSKRSCNPSTTRTTTSQARGCAPPLRWPTRVAVVS